MIEDAVTGLANHDRAALSWRAARARPSRPSRRRAVRRRRAANPLRGFDHRTGLASAVRVAATDRARVVVHLLRLPADATRTRESELECPVSTDLAEIVRSLDGGGPRRVPHLTLAGKNRRGSGASRRPGAGYRRQGSPRDESAFREVERRSEGRFSGVSRRRAGGYALATAST